MENGNRIYPAGIILAAVWVISSERMQAFIRPLLTGFCLSIFLEPLRKMFENLLVHFFRGRILKENAVRFVSVFLCFGAAAAGITLLVLYTGPKLAESAGQAFALISSLENAADRQAVSIGQELSVLSGHDLKIDLTRVTSLLWEHLSPLLAEAADLLAKGAGTLIPGVVFSGWMLLKKESLFLFMAKIFSLFPSSEQRLREELLLCRKTFAAFVRGQLTEAVILGSGCLAGMLLFRKPFAGLISLIIACTALVPVAGAIAGGAFGTLLLFSSSVSDGIWFLVFILLLQQLENNLIYPRVMGKTTGLPAVLVLSAVLLGGVLFGIPGMLLMVPAAGVLWQRFQMRAAP